MREQPCILGVATPASSWRRARALLLFATVLCAGLSRPGAAAAERRYVLTMNICGSWCGCPYDQDPKLPEWVAEHVQRFRDQGKSPWIVTLNEVCETQFQAIREFLAADGYQSAFDQAGTQVCRNGLGRYGNAIFYRSSAPGLTRQITYVNQRDLREGEEVLREKRSLMCVTATGNTYSACVTHLDADSDTVARQQAQEAHDFIGQLPTGPRILGADLNLERNDVEDVFPNPPWSHANDGHVMYVVARNSGNNAQWRFVDDQPVAPTVPQGERKRAVSCEDKTDKNPAPEWSDHPTLLAWYDVTGDEPSTPPSTSPSTIPPPTTPPSTTPPSTTTTTLPPNRPPQILGVAPRDGDVVPTNHPVLGVTASDPHTPLTYHFTVERPGLPAVTSGDLPHGLWEVPAAHLDPATTYAWTVCVRDATHLESCRRSQFRVQFMPVAAEMVATPDGSGYWTVDTRGAVRTFGNGAQHFGDLPSSGVAVQNVIGLARTADGGGYWLVGSDGGVFAFGNAQFYGSMGGQPLNRPVVGMTPTPDGLGYWLVADDGGVFAFGNAPFHGSMGGQSLNARVVAIAATKDGGGYWLVAADGGVFAFGNAGFFGSMGGTPLNHPVTDVAAHPSGQGYWLVAEDGGIFAFGAAQFFGTPAGYALAGRIIAMEATPDGGGYWLLGCDGGIFAYGNAPFFGAAPVNACRGIPGAPWPPAPPPGQPVPPPLQATTPTCEDHNPCTDDAHTFATGCTHRLTPRCTAPILGLLLDGVCGDGVLDPGEACDDGNTRNGDCCAGTCQLEPVGTFCSAGCEARRCDGAGHCRK